MNSVPSSFLFSARVLQEMDNYHSTLSGYCLVLGEKGEFPVWPCSGFMLQRRTVRNSSRTDSTISLTNIHTYAQLNIAVLLCSGDSP
jgi:hypothetical protein